MMGLDERCDFCRSRQGALTDFNVMSKGQIVRSIVLHERCLTPWIQLHGARLNGSRDPQVDGVDATAHKHGNGSQDRIKPAKAKLDDPNSIHLAGGPEAVREMFDAAKPAEPPRNDHKRSRSNTPDPDGSDAARTAPFAPPAYVAPDPKTIPRRQWLLDRHYLRGAVSATIGAPGRLKSSTELVEIIGMACGRDLLGGTDLAIGPLRAAYLNGEETQDELDRRIAAICQRYSLNPQSYAGRLWVMSTRDKPLRVAVPTPNGTGAMVDRAAVDGLAAWCERCALDVVAFDPLISFHSVRENSNEDMDVVAKAAFGVVASTARSVDLVHHPRKLAPGEVNTTVEDARGGSAILAAVRVARTFNFMTTSEATQLGIHEDERRKHVRVDNGKSNPGPMGKANWLRIEVEPLPNGDEVAVASSWTPPNPFDEVSPKDVELAAKLAASGDYRADSRSPEWFGYALAGRLNIAVACGADNDPKDLARLNAIIKTWLKNEVLAIEKRKDADSKERSFIVPGTKCPPSTSGPSATDDEVNL